MSDWLSDDEGKAASKCDLVIKQPQGDSVIGDTVNSGTAQPVAVCHVSLIVVVGKKVLLVSNSLDQVNRYARLPYALFHEVVE